MTETYTKNDVKEACDLRAKRAELKVQLKALDAERDGLSGSERGAVTRKMTPIEEKIERIDVRIDEIGAPVPMSPQEAADEVHDIIDRYADNASDALAKMQNRLAEGNVEAALVWESENAYKASLWLRDLRLLRKGAAYRVDDLEMDPFAALQDIVGELANRYQEDVERKGDGMIRSSNMLTNLCRVWEVEYTVNSLHGWSSFSDIQANIGYLADRVAAWHALHGNDA